MILGIADDHDSASTSLNLVALGDALWRVVRTFGVKIGTEFANQSPHIGFGKDYDRIHVGQRGQNFRAFIGWHYGPPLTLQGTHRRVGIDRDNEFATKFAGGMKIADVAYVQHVEASVGQRDAISGTTPIRHPLAKLVA